MIIERIICDLCGFEQQEDDYVESDWFESFKGSEICVTHGTDA